MRGEIRKAAAARRTVVPALAQAEERAAAMLTAEKALLWALIREPAAARTALGEIDAEDIHGLTTGPILQVALSLADFPPDALPATLVERLDADEAAIVRGVAAERAAPATNVTDCWTVLRRRRIERELLSLRDEIERRPADADVLLRRKQDLHRRKQELDDLEAGAARDHRNAAGRVAIGS